MVLWLLSSLPTTASKRRRLAPSDYSFSPSPSLGCISAGSDRPTPSRRGFRWRSEVTIGMVGFRFVISDESLALACIESPGRRVFYSLRGIDSDPGFPSPCSHGIRDLWTSHLIAKLHWAFPVRRDMQEKACFLVRCGRRQELANINPIWGLWKRQSEAVNAIPLPNHSRYASVPADCLPGNSGPESIPLDRERRKLRDQSDDESRNRLFRAH
jgi:hypothetical protein